MDAIDVAVERAKVDLLDSKQSDVHTVYRGLKERNGVLTDEEAVICVVAQKADASKLQALNFYSVPRAYSVEGAEVPTDVVEAPPASILRLNVDAVSVFAANELQRCHQCPLPGGVQMAPKGANWVGTLGSAFAFPDSSGQVVYGGLTNYHVAYGGRFGVGTPMLQPGPGSQYFGTLARFCPIKFGGRQGNLIDAALLNCRRTDGPYAPATDTVKPFQFGIGNLNPEPYTAVKLGDDVIKVGRTTAITRGKLVGVNASTNVDYGPEGVARFDRQFIFRAASGSFSAGGDSGSVILHAATLRPVSLLFAGGGRDTIGNPIQFVLDWSKGWFFGV